MDTNKAFNILEIEHTKSIKEVKQAYRDLVFVWHPDRLGSNKRIKKKAEEKLKSINNAYEILKEKLVNQPQKLFKIFISPNIAEIEQNNSYSFRVFGIDSEGNEMEIEQAVWNSSGGTIYQDGLFFADTKAGKYKIAVTVENLKAHAEIIIKESKKSSNLDKKENYNFSDKNKTTSNDNDNLKNDVVNKNELQIDNNNWLKNSIKVLVWLLISWACFSTEYSEPTSISENLFVLLTLSWIVGLICPNVVIRFGLPNDKATVSKLYTSLIILLFGFFCLSPDLAQEGTNIFVKFLILPMISFCELGGLFILIYPDGTIFENYVREEYKGNRFTAGLGLMFCPISLAIIWALMVAAWEFIF